MAAKVSDNQAVGAGSKDPRAAFQGLKNIVDTDFPTRSLFRTQDATFVRGQNRIRHALP